MRYGVTPSVRGWVRPHWSTSAVMCLPTAKPHPTPLTHPQVHDLLQHRRGGGHLHSSTGGAAGGAHARAGVYDVTGRACVLARGSMRWPSSCSAAGAARGAHTRAGGHSSWCVCGRGRTCACFSVHQQQVLWWSCCGFLRWPRPCEEEELQCTAPSRLTPFRLLRVNLVTAGVALLRYPPPSLTHAPPVTHDLLTVLWSPWPLSPSCCGLNLVIDSLPALMDTSAPPALHYLLTSLVSCHSSSPPPPAAAVG